MNGFPCHPGHAPTLFRVAPGKALSQLPMLINHTNYGLKLWLWHSATSAPDCLPPRPSLGPTLLWLFPQLDWGPGGEDLISGELMESPQRLTDCRWILVEVYCCQSTQGSAWPASSLVLFSANFWEVDYNIIPALQMKEGRFREVRVLCRNCTGNRMKCVDSQSERAISTVQEHKFHTMLPLTLGSDWQNSRQEHTRSL